MSSPLPRPLLSRNSGLKLPLLVVFTIPFVVQVVVAVGLVGYLSFRNGQQTVENLIGQLQLEIGNRVNLYLTGFITKAELLNQVTVDAVNRGDISLDLNVTRPSRDRFLWQQMQKLDSISWVSLSAQQRGEFLGVTRKDNTWQIKVVNSKTNYQSTYYAIDPIGRRTQRLNAEPRRYDARLHPWYKAAQKARQPIWSPIYPGATLGTSSMTIAQPIYDRQANLRGVVASSFALQSIEKYLANLNISPKGKVFLVERSGLIVASSTPESPFLLDAQGNLRQRLASESDVPLIRSTAQTLQRSFPSFSTLQNQQKIEFTQNSERQFVQIRPLRNEHGIDWLMVMVIPEGDFMAQIHHNTRHTIGLCSIALLIATLTGACTARWVTLPISRLDRAAKDIAAGRFDDQIHLDRSDELGSLSTSFNQMAIQVQASFKALQASEQRLASFLETVPCGGLP
ncbi:MAG: HAMP domain-containing protein [Leptolyngbyaceae cyanobacterium CSU_1_3]|nr:HAMP domain-containing protein [Leptolyngbyaceae cyanobacterium CSU_1_3]